MEPQHLYHSPEKPTQPGAAVMMVQSPHCWQLLQATQRKAQGKMLMLRSKGLNEQSREGLCTSTSSQLEFWQRCCNAISVQHKVFSETLLQNGSGTFIHCFFKNAPGVSIKLETSSCCQHGPVSTHLCVDTRNNFIWLSKHFLQTVLFCNLNALMKLLLTLHPLLYLRVLSEDLLFYS